MKEKIEHKGIQKEVKELVLAKLDVMPSNRRIAIGKYGDFSKEELKEHVNKEDEIGQKIAEIQMSFLKAVAEGKIYVESKKN